MQGNTTNEYVFMAGRRIARRNSSGNVYYYYSDALGSPMTITDSSGNPCYVASYTPYGQEMATTNTCPQNYKFTGYEQDTETGLYYAFARYYSPRLGRFLSPDPLGGGTADPQSLNRYAYGANNPVNFVDPFGLFTAPPVPIPVSETNGGSDWTTWAWGAYPGMGSGSGIGLQGNLGGTGGGGGAGFSPNWHWPEPPPHWKDCLKAIGDAPNAPFSPELLSVTQNWDAISQGASNFDVDPAIVAAIGIRETGFQDITGDNGHGHGYFQIDDRWNAPWVPYADDVYIASGFVSLNLSTSFRAYRKQGQSAVMAMAAAIRNYNGTGKIPTSVLLATGYPGHLDLGTKHNNYVSQVLAIATNCFP